MSDATKRSRTTFLPPAAALAAVTTTVVVAAVSFAGSARAASVDVPLGTAAQFAVLAGAGITNTGPTTVTGDLGTFPTTTIDGSASITTTGVIRGGDAVAQGAKPDLVSAYDAAAAALPPTPLSADISGQTLAPGVYSQDTALGLTGTVTLDGRNDPSSVFIIQVGSALTTASASRVALINGAQACHVYWQVGSSATFGTGSAFRGNVLALTSITATTAATFEGRLLARNGAVTLDTNTISVPACATATPTPTATPSATPTPTATAPASGVGRPSATPTRTAPSDDDTDDSDDSSGDTADDSDGSGAGAQTGGSGSDVTDASASTTGLPDTGGPSGLLAPIGALAVAAGAAMVLASRRRRGVHRA